MRKIDALSGNECVAKAVQLCKPDIIAAYPITPQSSVVEKLAAMVANDELESKVCDVESEHSSMSVVRGAAMVGKRVFTATAGQGLAYMYEPYFSMATMRLPMVMTLACREMISPGTVWSGLQDALSVRDSGWMQIFCESNQEILDMVIQGYKISENPEVRIPINICYDGFFLSHQTQRVEVPDSAEVDEFLPLFHGKQWLDVDNPGVMDPNTVGEELMKYRENHLKAMQKAKEVIVKTNDEFAGKFGRNYGGLIEVASGEDAEVFLITMGAITGAARVAVANARKTGHKVGLIKVRSMRPFPDKEIAQAVKGAKAVAVVDKSVSFGWNTGILFEEIAAVIGKYNLGIKAMPFIGGLGGYDVRTEYLDTVVRKLVDEAGTDTTHYETGWLNEQYL